MIVFPWWKGWKPPEPDDLPPDPIIKKGSVLLAAGLLLMLWLKEG